jgi:hypothetical protein
MKVVLRPVVLRLQQLVDEMESRLAAVRALRTGHHTVEDEPHRFYV